MELHALTECADEGVPLHAENGPVFLLETRSRTITIDTHKKVDLLAIHPTGFISYVA